MEEMELEDPLYELAYISCVGKTPRERCLCTRDRAICTVLREWGISEKAIIGSGSREPASKPDFQDAAGQPFI